MTGTGLSIHVGVGRVDPSRYAALPALDGPVNDANAMAEQVAGARGFAVQAVLLNEAATADRLKAELRGAADALAAGDFLLLTFAGHGGRLPHAEPDDQSDDELARRLESESDQTWCLFDRQVLDDELFALWTRFKPGVRIAVVSDSCYSGTILKELALDDAPPAPADRGLTSPEAVGSFRLLRDAYEGLQQQFGFGRCPEVAASVILLAACQDCEQAFDGAPHGVFTAALLDVWQGGAFAGSLLDLHEAVYGRVKGSQRPNYMKVGAPMASFDTGPAFRI